MPLTVPSISISFDEDRSVEILDAILFKTWLAGLCPKSSLLDGKLTCRPLAELLILFSKTPVVDSKKISHIFILSGACDNGPGPPPPLPACSLTS